MNTGTTAAKPNRLASCTSPYLLQHAHNPVDWWPWRQEAFDEARRQDKPVFLSVGYSSCHWCHVMAHESFERPDVAAVLNENFICIKVDREERPDLDDIYMTATQLFTGRGGWPNSVFLTGQAEPWYAGTYWPADDRPGIIGFKTLLGELARLWRTRRDDVLKQARRITLSLRQTVLAEGPRTTEPLGRQSVQQALRTLHETFDLRFGGLGNAPKFPPHGALALVGYELGRERKEAWEDMLFFTLRAMAMGGIHDHVGGGFHRYSTDQRWLLPHFEKMLYDNAQLLASYAQAWQLSGQEEFRQAAMGIVDWLGREMLDPQGGFYSALDADSEGVEGRYYLWRQDEIIQALGQEEGELFCRIFNVQEEGNFLEEASAELVGSNVLHLGRPIPATAKVEGLPPQELRQRLADDLGKLRQRRQQRVRPALDDKILASWNGLAIAGLAKAGRIFQDRRCIDLAEGAANFVMTRMFRAGRLVASYRQGPGPTRGYLDDYAFMALGLIELHEASPQPRRLEQAQELMAVVEREFPDARGGGYFFTARDHEDLLVRMKNPFDSAIPSGNAVAAQVQARLATLTGRQEYWRGAERTLAAFRGILQQAPHAAVNMTLSLAIFLDNVPPELAPHPPAALDQPALAESKQGPVKLLLLRQPLMMTAAAGEAALTAKPGQTLHLAVEIAIDEGWHVNSAQPLQDALSPTKVELAAGPARLESVSYPPGQSVQLPFNDVPLSVYQGQVRIELALTVNSDAPPGRTRLALLVCLQPCDNLSCQEPQQHRLEFELEIQERQNE